MLDDHANMPGKVVAFFEYNLGIRGTQGTMWALADYNERVLGNKSIIITRSPPTWEAADHNYESVYYFLSRFEVFYVPIAETCAWLQKVKVDAAYIVLSGRLGEVDRENLVPRSIPTITHCVFACDNKDGTIQTTISDYLSKLGNGCVVLPNVIHVNKEITSNMREDIGIPQDAKVFGRYGGYPTFNIPFVLQTIAIYAASRPDVYFIFMNTEPFGPKLPNMIFMEGTRDMTTKMKFINTCDAMIHARADGETYGMACGEFATMGKPVISSNHGDTAHLDYLGDAAIIYKDAASLWGILDTFMKPRYRIENTKYEECTIDKVGPKFAKLLDDAITKHHSDGYPNEHNVPM